MALQVLNLISSLYKSQSRHLMLSGINQEIFIRQWGMPEFNIYIDNLNLREFFRTDFLPSDGDFLGNDIFTAWIYEKMDIFVLFRKGRLIAHFKWSEIREKFKKTKGDVDSEGDQSLSDLMLKSLFT